MLFSLDEQLESTFGILITEKEKSKILRDIRKIRLKYRKDRGFFQYIRLSAHKVLLAFETYSDFDHDVSKKIVLWDEFKEYALEEGAYLIDYLI